MKRMLRAATICDAAALASIYTCAVRHINPNPALYTAAEKMAWLQGSASSNLGQSASPSPIRG